MKNTKYYLCFGVLFICLNSSCTKDFSALNTNPNTAEKVLPENLLAKALVETVQTNMNQSRNINNELIQVSVNTLVETDRIFRYDIRRTVSESAWNGWYRQLTNFKDMYSFASENKTDENKSKVYKAISLICQSWIHSMITDTYGDTPYFESNKAKEGIYTPAFDLQKDIYSDIFLKLEEANTLLQGAKDVSSIQDPLYGGNVYKWRKFGNSLYLRLLMRVSGKAEVADAAIAKIQEMVDSNPVNYPIMAFTSESAILKWTGIAPLNSPFANFKSSSWRYSKACSFFVDNLDQSADPCISRWVTLENGLYEGIPSGYTHGQTPEPKSYLQYSLTTDPLLGNILNYAEVQFILAEAAAKGWITSKTGEEYYKAGINSRIELWGRSVGAYLDGPMIKWNDTESLDDKMEKIHWQKYLSLFYTDMQAWIEYRRTGHPVLPQGSGLLNDGIMPTRLQYPLSVQASNYEQYQAALEIQGPDDLQSVMWWQKP